MIGRLTVWVTALAFLTTVALVTAMVLSLQGVAEAVFTIRYWGWFFPLPFVLVVATYLLRHSAGLLMLARGDGEGVLSYCLPRVDVSVSVGRNEAALNRYAAAEATRTTGLPAEALTLLEADFKAPWRKDVSQLLLVARAQSLLDLDRPGEARAILATLGEGAISAGSKDAFEGACRRSDALPPLS